MEVGSKYHRSTIEMLSYFSAVLYLLSQACQSPRIKQFSKTSVLVGKVDKSSQKTWSLVDILLSRSHMSTHTPMLRFITQWPFSFLPQNVQ